MLDLLACPIDKHYPLELFEISIKREDNNNDDIIISDRNFVLCQMSPVLSNY